jgi:hypothetical protein
MRDHSQEPLPSFRSAWTGEGARPHTVLDVPTAFAISNPTSPYSWATYSLSLR